MCGIFKPVTSAFVLGLIFCLWPCSTRLTLAETFTLGYITGSKRRPHDRGYSRPGLSISGAISLAIDEINRDHTIIGGHNLTFIVAETYGEEMESILQTAELWTQNVSAYIGPQETCVHEGRLAASFNLPMISYFCAHPETSNKTFYPTFARTRPPDTQISKSVASLLLFYGWKKVTLLHSGARDSPFVHVASTIVRHLEEVGVEVMQQLAWSETYHYGYDRNPFDKLVEDTYRETRIYLVLGYYFEHIGLMVSLQEKGLLDSGEYFVVGIDVEQYDRDAPRRYLKGLLQDDIDVSAQRAFRSYLGVVGSSPVGFEDFNVKVNYYMQMPPFNFPNPLVKVGGMKMILAEGAYLYDSVYLYARALNTCLELGQDPRNGSAIFSHLQGRTYLSAMGYMVSVDSNGDAAGNYTLIARRALHPEGAPQDYGLVPVGGFRLAENASTLPVLHLWEPMEWVGSGPPLDEPHCGFHNEKCIMWKIATGVTGGVVLALLLVVFAVYKNWSYEQELDSLLWKIEYKDLQVIDHVTPTSTPTNQNGGLIAGSKALRSIHPVIRTSQVSLSSNPDADFRYSALYTHIGIYRGRVCAIKRLRKKSVDINRAIKKDLKTMRDLRHDNLNVFVGACVDPPNLCIVTEYCGRGSLKDILENEDVKLDNMFVASLVADIIRGMIFLHESSIRSHGNLKSSNCLVDSRWVLKISDFGLHELKKDAEASDDVMDFEKECQKLLWKAPELLRDPDAPPCGTKKGDSYSFGVVLYELVGRQGPYGNLEITPSEIIKRVMRRGDGAPFRPPMDILDNVFDCVRQCLKECWQEEPDSRPDFKVIRERLRPMRKGMKPNIFDNMLAMMEKYANNLEALVDERTYQLIEEKKKTEALLYEMLPKYVADQLKQGHKVEAESFDSVTIYFSDIVGFTSMSAQSSPLQVVDFLNDLYTCFDSIIGNHDVYKVETIGDAYMVVSGLPIRNGDNHAGQVASLALSLLEAVQKFQIRHRPGDKLMLRIGIHSGPVCAGVVGLKMPRYCLFGDTVNTASRMESTGLPLRIHCSSACKLILDKLGGYVLEDRGVISIKGKGDMRTYWLLGESEERRQAAIINKSTLSQPTANELKASNSNLTRSSFKKQHNHQPPTAVVPPTVNLEQPPHSSPGHNASRPESPEDSKTDPDIKDFTNTSSQVRRASSNDIGLAFREGCSWPLRECNNLSVSEPTSFLGGKRTSCPCLDTNCDCPKDITTLTSSQTFPGQPDRVIAISKSKDYVEMLPFAESTRVSRTLLPMFLFGSRSVSDTLPLLARSPVTIYDDEEEGEPIARDVETIAPTTPPMTGYDRLRNLFQDCDRRKTVVEHWESEPFLTIHPGTSNNNHGGSRTSLWVKKHMDELPLKDLGRNLEVNCNSNSTASVKK